MCPTHRWAGKGGYRGQKACHFQRKINVISQLGLLHTGTLFSRSFKQNGCVPVAPLGYPSQPLPQMKATRIIFSVPTSLLQFNAVFILNTSAYTHRMAKMVKKTQAVLWQPTWPKCHLTFCDGQKKDQTNQTNIGMRQWSEWLLLRHVKSPLKKQPCQSLRDLLEISVMHHLCIFVSDVSYNPNPCCKISHILSKFAAWIEYNEKKKAKYKNDSSEPVFSGSKI